MARNPDHPETGRGENGMRTVRHPLVVWIGARRAGCFGFIRLHAQHIGGTASRFLHIKVAGRLATAHPGIVVRRRKRGLLIRLSTPSIPAYRRSAQRRLSRKIFRNAKVFNLFCLHHHKNFSPFLKSSGCLSRLNRSDMQAVHRRRPTIDSLKA